LKKKEDFLETRAEVIRKNLGKVGGGEKTDEAGRGRKTKGVWSWGGGPELAPNEGQPVTNKAKVPTR